MVDRAGEWLGLLRPAAANPISTERDESDKSDQSGSRVARTDAWREPPDAAAFAGLVMVRILQSDSRFDWSSELSY